MRIKYGISIIILLCFGRSVLSQSVTVLLGKMSFEKNLKVTGGNALMDEQTIDFNTATRDFSQGVRGTALDLSASSSVRWPVRVPLTKPDLASFTIKIWVKTEPGVSQVHAIASNRPNQADTTMGWTLAAQENGSWNWSASDGTVSFEYTPTFRRQPINDGRWHQLAFSFDQDNQKVRLYYDGTNVAIYHIGEMGSITGDVPIFLGAQASFDKSEMWTCNGLLDEFELWGGVITDADIEKAYLQFFPGKMRSVPEPPSRLKFLTWNIWHGGREHGNEVGVQRVIDVIRNLNPDIICMIETYGSGPKIADAFGYHFYLRSSNLSIMSKYPFGDFIDVFQPFNCGGIYVNMGDDRMVAVVNTWLHYLPDYRQSMLEDQIPAEEIFINEGETRYAEIVEILDDLEPVLKNTNKIPLIMAGDFNTPSHLDFTRQMEETHWGYIIEWPVTKEIEEHGLMDSFREIHPDPGSNYGGTQPSHIFDTFHYRIDYIFYRGKALKPVDSRVISGHPVKFPSDHDAVFTVFEMSY